MPENYPQFFRLPGQQPARIASRDALAQVYVGNGVWNDYDREDILTDGVPVSESESQNLMRAYDASLAATA
jgi:hypothetical protein